MIHISEILVILVVVLLIFGTGKFPKIMQNFAEGIKSFKKAMNEKDEGKKPAKKAKKSSSKPSKKSSKKTSTKKKKSK
ncbi:MAG: twin-arginine translocase TatA/TatE family subunit [Alphaproteobacteria bacterium]|nr:twin-arginine translocase TatA/TatE family subunit [Alphaproteobacteria bacterium]